MKKSVKKKYAKPEVKDNPKLVDTNNVDKQGLPVLKLLATLEGINARQNRPELIIDLKKVWKRKADTERKRNWRAKEKEAAAAAAEALIADDSDDDDDDYDDVLHNMSDRDFLKEVNRRRKLQEAESAADETGKKTQRTRHKKKSGSTNDKQPPIKDEDDDLGGSQRKHTRRDTAGSFEAPAADEAPAAAESPFKEQVCGILVKIGNRFDSDSKRAEENHAVSMKSHAASMRRAEEYHASSMERDKMLKKEIARSTKKLEVKIDKNKKDQDGVNQKQVVTNQEVEQRQNEHEDFSNRLLQSLKKKGVKLSVSPLGKKVKKLWAKSKSGHDSDSDASSVSSQNSEHDEESDAEEEAKEKQLAAKKAAEEKAAKEREAKESVMKLMRQLTDEEQNIVDSAIHGIGPVDEKLVRQDADSVQRGSMQTLQPNTWLNDEIINYFLKNCLAKRDEKLCAKQPGQKRSHFFNSFFVQTMFDEKNSNPSLRGKYKYNKVKRRGKKVPGKDVFNLRYIVCPINLDNQHWTSAVIFMELKKIQYFDSMGGTDRSKLEGLLQYLKDEHKAKKGKELDVSEWELVPCTMDTPRQRNGFDCGVFTCMNCDFVSKDCPLVFTQDHINQCRQRIALSIMKNCAI